MLWKILMAQIRKKIYYSLLSCGTFPEEQKGCPKGTRGTRKLLCIDQHIFKESKEMEKCSYGVDWLQKSIWYGLTKLDNRLSQNVHYIWLSHKVYPEYQGKLEQETDSRTENLSWGENPERDLPGRCTITITICNSKDASEPHI